MNLCQMASAKSGRLVTVRLYVDCTTVRRCCRIWLGVLLPCVAAVMVHRRGLRRFIMANCHRTFPKTFDDFHVLSFFFCALCTNSFARSFASYINITGPSLHS